MQVLYNEGVQVGRITFDPRKPVPVAFWTHRPPRRPRGGRILTSEGLARRWPGTIGLPIGHTGVAMGLRLELLASGYGAAGVAVMVTREGHRTLVVGPTSAALIPRRAEQLVLYVPTPRGPEEPTEETLIEWLKIHLEPAHEGRLRVPDRATAERVCHRLAAAGVPVVPPPSLGGRPRRQGQLRVVFEGPGLWVDARPQAEPAWLRWLVAQVDPERLWLHGPGATPFAAALQDDGWPAQLLVPPEQLPLRDAPPSSLEGEGRPR